VVGHERTPYDYNVVFVTRRTVLIVDDERAVRELVAAALTRAGFDVQTAGSAEEALDLEARRAVDLLVTDVLLPKISGPELADLIRRRSPDTRVLFMSGYTGNALTPNDLRQGSAFLPKPFGTTALIARVQEVLNPPRN
jgi:two-component system, cell cycle sensor histidine kinase and response regulator CckA